jgi:predicted peroxiredoxin
MSDESSFTVMLTTGKADHGKAATLGFSCAVASIAMGNETTVFLTGDGSVWGYQQNATGTSVQGFPPLDGLISDFLESGGEIYICSVCHRTCSIDGPNESRDDQLIEGVKIGGFTVAIEKAQRGPLVTF